MGRANQLNIGYIMQADSVPMHIPSGPQLHVLAVIKGLQKRGHHVRLFSKQKDEIGWTDDLATYHVGEYGFSQSFAYRRLLETPIRVVQNLLRMPYYRFFDSQRFADAATRALKGYDILYERYGLISYAGILTARSLQIPIILEVNGDIVQEYKQMGMDISSAQWKAIRWVTKQMYRYADHIIAVSPLLRDSLIEQWDIPLAKISMVPNGADIDLLLSITPDEIKAVQEKYEIAGKPSFIFVGSFQPWHSLDLLIDAFKLIAPDYPEARLLLVGDGALRVEMEEQTNIIQDQVIFTGRLPHREVATLLRATDIAVLAHHISTVAQSSLPLKLFEYMGVGKAIITSTYFEGALVDHETALLVPPSDVEGLAQAMRELLNNPNLCRQLGKAAQQQAITKHSWDATVEQIEKIIYSLLEIR